MKRRAAKDPVSPAIREYVLRRDGGCVIWALFRGGDVPDPGPCRLPLTIAHVRDSAGGRLGKRPPSSRRRLVAVCAGHHLDDPIVDRADVRPLVDAYLAAREGFDADASRPWEAVRRVRARNVDSLPSDRRGGAR